MKQIITMGGGVNSVAMTLLLIHQGKEIDFILFSDTLAEKPETYEYLKYFSDYLVRLGSPPITVLRHNNEGLYNECMRRNALPSIAYGFKTCSQKWKIAPADKFLNANVSEWPAVKYIGFDEGEAHRAKPYSDARYIIKYPLIEAGMDRADCVKYIIDSGLKVPPKSACFFCPSSTEAEVRRLAKNNPELIEKALALEKNAKLTTLAGLGRRWSWGGKLKQAQLFDIDEGSGVPIACICNL